MAPKKWWEYTTVLCEQIPAFDIPKDFAKKEVQFCKRLGAEAFAYFVDLDGEYIWPSQYGPFYRKLGKRDLLRELVTETKKAGLRFIAAFMGQHCQTALAKKHPDWVVRGLKNLKTKKYVSMGPTVLCLNSPYRQILQGMTREMIVDYGVDGIYYDGVYYPPYFCFCKGCREKYRRLFGKKMPLKLKDTRRTKLGEETVVGWSREIRELINRTNPDVCYVLNCHEFLIGHSDSRECIHKTADFVDVFWNECYPEIIQEQPYYAEFATRCIAAETGKTVWWDKWIARNPDNNIIGIAPAALVQWGANTLGAGTPAQFCCQRARDFDKRCIEPMARIGRLRKKAKPHARDAETVAPVALFHSLESKLQRLPVRIRDQRKFF